MTDTNNTPKTPAPATEPDAYELPKNVPESVVNVLNEDLINRMNFMSSYKGLNARAVTNAVHGADFRAVEDYFTFLQQGDEEKLRTVVAEAFRTNALTVEDFEKTKRVIGRSFAEFQNSPLAREGFSTTEINKAFVRDYVKDDGPLHQPVHSANSEQELLHGILQKTDGFCLADVHISDKSSSLLARNMQQLKKDGVEAIYTELSGRENWQVLSLGELKQLARDGHYKEFNIIPAEENAKNFGVPHSDPVDLSILKMNIAARENNVRVVWIDKLGEVVRNEERMDHRVATDNYIWVDNIRADQKAHPGKDGKAQKFVVLGGFDHFSSAHFKDQLHHGMVAKALGVPFLAYEKTADKSPAVRKGNNPNGADYYLAGGSNYYDVLPELVDARHDFIKMEKSNSDYHVDPTAVTVPKGLPLEPPAATTRIKR